MATRAHAALVELGAASVETRGIGPISVDQFGPGLQTALDLD